MIQLVRQLTYSCFRTIAEIHFRLPGFKGFLHKPWPEVIFDVPFRTENTFLQLFLLVKDADVYPAKLESFEILDPDGQSIYVEHINLELNQKWFWKTFRIPEHFLTKPQMEFYIQFLLHTQQGKKGFINDSLPHSGKKPFKIIFTEPRPGIPGFAWGDIHLHSSYTEDQIEFGAPLDYLQIAFRELGLDFFCITDHSYDLDQQLIRFRKQIHDSEKFQKFISQVKSNRKKPYIIPGIEVSVGNTKNHNVHLLVLNPQKMHEGYGDSGRKWLSHSPTIHLKEFLDLEAESDEILIAAHPFQKVKKLHRWLLKRDRWHEEDLLQEGILGYQILNGYNNEDFLEGKSIWIKHLLAGKKKFIFAGSDAHGNLNLYRQIEIPFLRIQYDESHKPGKFVTGVYTGGKKISRKSILENIRKGRVIVSSGPLLWISIEKDGFSLHPGDECPPETIKGGELKITCISTSEFGSIDYIMLYGGIQSKGFEKTLKIITLDTDVFEVSEVFTIESIISDQPISYIRAEMVSKKNEMAVTNPIWIE